MRLSNSPGEQNQLATRQHQSKYPPNPGFFIILRTGRQGKGYVLNSDISDKMIIDMRCLAAGTLRLCTTRCAKERGANRCRATHCRPSNGPQLNLTAFRAYIYSNCTLTTADFSNIRRAPHSATRARADERERERGPAPCCSNYLPRPVISVTFIRRNSARPYVIPRCFSPARGTTTSIKLNKL